MPERAEQSVWKAAKYNMFFLVTVAILFFTGAEWIMMFFTTNKDVIASGVKCLRFVSLGYAFYGYGMVVSQSFNGAGDTKTPTIINLFGFWAFQIPLAYVLAKVCLLYTSRCV